MLDNQNGFEAPSLITGMSPMKNFLRKKLRDSNSEALGSSLIKVVRLITAVTKSPPPDFIRAVVATGLPIDPLGKETRLPTIDIVIPFVEKDIRVLKYCVESVTQNVRNPIACIRLITPADKTGNQAIFKEEGSQDLLTDVLKSYPNVKLEFDHSVLGPKIFGEISRNFPGGWVVQQLVKFAACLNSASSASLIVDADTVLLSPKTWLAEGGTQLLQVAHEYENRYLGHIRDFFSLEKSLLLSFVTHHSLFQKDVVELMFPHGKDSLFEWWTGSTDKDQTFLSEFETYGSFLYERYPERVALGSWSNLLSPYFAKFENELEKKERKPSEILEDYCSVSFHAHCQA